MYQIEELIGPRPAGSRNVAFADKPIDGAEAKWMAVATEVQTDLGPRYLSGLIRLEAGGTQAQIYQPVWADSDVALGAAEKLISKLSL